MSKWDEMPYSVASKLELGTKDHRHVPLCPNSMEEEENLHLLSPVPGDFPLANTFLSYNFVDTEAKKLCQSFKVT